MEFKLISDNKKADEIIIKSLEEFIPGGWTDKLSKALNELNMKLDIETDDDFEELTKNMMLKASKDNEDYRRRVKDLEDKKNNPTTAYPAKIKIIESISKKNDDSRLNDTIATEYL